MQTRSFHVTYTDRNGAIRTARTSGTGSTPARQRAAAILNVKSMHPGSRNFSAVGVRIHQPPEGAAPQHAFALRGRRR